METLTINYRDRDYEVEFEYRPESGDNWNEPWNPERVFISKIDGQNPFGIYAERFIIDLEYKVLYRIHEIIEDRKAERIIENRYE